MTTANPESSLQTRRKPLQRNLCRHLSIATRMAALTGYFGLAAARILTCLTAVSLAGSATARNVCALLVFRFFHQSPRFRRYLRRDTLVAEICPQVA